MIQTHPDVTDLRLVNGSRARKVPPALEDRVSSQLPKPEQRQDNSNETPSSQLKIAHVTWGLAVGGMEKLLVEIAKHSDPQGVELHFISLGPRGDLAPEIEKCGWPVTALNEPEGLRPQMILRLASLFRKLQPDVLHTHNTKALVYAGPAAKLARVQRVVHTWHGWSLLASPMEALWFRLMSRLPNRIVAVANHTASLMQQDGIPAKKILTILNGIDTSKFAYTGPQENGPVVTVAQLRPEKDIPTLIRAAAIIQKEMPDFRLHIAGEGDCRPEVEGLIHTLRLQNNVHLLGQVDNVPTLLSRASLAVLPSVTEGLSLTLMEAMARGLPVVATKVGGNPEVVEQNQTGLLVPPSSPEELAKAILTILKDPAKAREMGKAGRKRIETHFDIHKMVSSYEKVYKNLTGPKKPPLKSVRPRILSNIPKLDLQRDLVNHEYLDVEANPTNIFLFWLKSFDKDALILDQTTKELVLLTILRILFPFNRTPIVSLDLVLSRPGNSPKEKFKAFLKSILLRQVDLYLMHLKDGRPLKEAYQIPVNRVSYIPFKVNALPDISAREVPEGDYIFTGGRSRRDYRTFCAALEGLEYPGIIVTPPPDETSLHGTSLEGVTPPKNVKLVHDDGSLESWLDKIARCRLAVFCISPETISPSGVSAYLMAMAFKKCVIISDSPSTRGILTHEKNAILVPMSDPAILHQAIQKAWEDDTYRRRIAEGGHQYAMSLGGEETLVRNVATAVVKFLNNSGQ